MYVCVCLAVTEAEVEAAIAGGAHSREAVTSTCRAGGDCGACHGMIETKIEDHLEVQPCSGCPAHPHASPAPAFPDGADSETRPQLVSAEALVRGRAA
jgi:bacterioferritin-associated ferredoxin